MSTRAVVPNYAVIFNDAANQYIESGMRTYRAEKLAREDADAVAQIGRCTPRPVDWDAS